MPLLPQCESGDVRFVPPDRMSSAPLFTMIIAFRYD